VGVLLVGFVGAVIPDDCDYSMEAYWKMDGDATDSSGEGHDGSGWPGGGTLKVDSAADFDGSDKITVLDIGNILQFGFTIEMWVKKNGAPVADGILFEKGDYVIEYLTSGAVRGSVGGVSVASGVLDIGTPYHIALVWEANTATLTLYVDGSNVDSVALFSPSIYVGSVGIGDGFVGLMDEVAVYGRAFDGGDIGLHYALSDIGKDYCDESGVNGSSTTKSNFNIAGCTLPGGDGLAVDTCSRGEIDGEYYCDDSRFLWVTREVGYGCSLGSGTYVLGSPFCCPAGMLCNATGGAFRCEYRLGQCYNQTNKEDCEAIGCVWLEEEGVCADGTRDYSCSLYGSESECLLDIWNLGRTGIGTEFCGSYIECAGKSYTIPYDSCGCKWNSGSEVCELYMEGSETYYDNETLKKWFSCAKDYIVAECVDGEQDVSWTARSETHNYFPEICLDIMGCSDGSFLRVCGEPIIKLPGFSLFALFGSIFIVYVFYLMEGFK